MQLREMRVGNYYHWEAEGKKYLYQIEPKDFANNNYLNFEEVPLTEEWLLKFGYIHNKKWNIYHLSKYNIDNISHQEDSRIVFRIYDDKIQCFQFYLDSMSNPQWKPRLIFLKYLRFVHEFQNFNFIVGGKELTYE